MPDNDCTGPLLLVSSPTSQRAAARGARPGENVLLSLHQRLSRIADMGCKPRRIQNGDDFSNRHPALIFWRSMIFSENRYPLFGIMLVLAVPAFDEPHHLIRIDRRRGTKPDQRQ